MIKDYLILFLIGCMIFNPATLFAAPSKPQVVRGNADVIQSGNTTTVNVISNRAVINWDSLNTNSGDRLEFAKLNGNFSVLNRVTGSGPTVFNGSLFGNQGHIIIVNKNGLIFGPSSIIQARAFTASALDMRNSDFMDGVLRFTDGMGSVENQGRIEASRVALIGKSVFNSGTIISDGGFVVMAAGDKVYMGQEDSDILVQIDTADEGINDVINRGKIETNGGDVVLAAGDIVSKAISGVDHLAVRVSEGSGMVQQQGTINAGSSDKGGDIILAATDLVFAGKESVTSSNGDTSGGSVILKSLGYTIVDTGAKIEAKGFNGGLAEISGGHFIYDGDIDLSNSGGSKGELKFDPAYLHIADGARPSVPLVDTIYEQDVEGFSQAGVDVTYQAVHGIDFANMSDDLIDCGNGDLTFLTTAKDGYINFADKFDTLAATSGDISFVSGSGGINIGNLWGNYYHDAIAPGEIKLQTLNGGDIDTGYLETYGLDRAVISLSSSGDIRINGEYWGGGAKSIVINENNVLSGYTEVCLEAKGDITTKGDVRAYSSGDISSESKVHICAGGDISLDLVDGSIVAYAYTTPGGESSKATINIHAGNDITIINGWEEDPVHVYSYVGYDNEAVINGTGRAEMVAKTDGGSSGLLEIANNFVGECKDCPTPIIKPDPDPQPEPEPDPKPEPEPEPQPQTASIPLPKREKPVIEGCPALLESVSNELGIAKDTLQISIEQAMATNPNIQPCGACANLVNLAEQLSDPEGRKMAEVTQVFNSIAPANAPFTPELGAVIASTLQNAAEGTSYANVSEFIDAFAKYAKLLDNEFNSTKGDSVAFVMQKYGTGIQSSGNANIAAYVGIKLEK